MEQIRRTAQARSPRLRRASQTDLPLLLAALSFFVAGNIADAEEIRDSMLFVSGALNEKAGGPSEELTPLSDRRTVYGRISRYKLDEFLQLFDFPSPNLSAEKRFTTSVPLQRLFLMNSDFIQVEAEELAKKVAGEADNRARIRKIYTLVYGRDPREDEIQAGLDEMAEKFREMGGEVAVPV